MAGRSGGSRILVFVLVILFCVSLAGLAWRCRLFLKRRHANLVLRIRI